VKRLKGLDYNGKKFIIRRVIRLEQLKPNFDSNIMKKWTMSDTLLKKDGWLYCCETINEAEILGYNTQTANVRRP